MRFGMGVGRNGRAIDGEASLCDIAWSARLNNRRHA